MMLLHQYWAGVLSSSRSSCRVCSPHAAWIPRLLLCTSKVAAHCLEGLVPQGLHVNPRGSGLRPRVTDELKIDDKTAAEAIRDVQTGREYSFLVNAYKPRFYFWCSKPSLLPRSVASLPSHSVRITTERASTWFASCCSWACW